MMDEDWLWPRAMTPTRQAKLLCEIRHLMPPVIYATTADGVGICTRASPVPFHARL